MGNLSLAELESMHERLLEARSKYPRYSAESRKATDAIYGSEENMDEYLDWFCTKRQSILHISKPASPTYKEYKSLISEANFNNKSNLEHLSEVLDLPAKPHVPIGTWGGIRFSLFPCTDTLLSDDSDRYQVYDNDCDLPESFLHVCIDVQASNDHGHEGTRSVMPSPPLTPPRALLQKEFVIFQLGMLKFFPSSSRKLSDGESLSDEWVDTGFVVVMKVHPNGTQGGIYIIYNSDQVCDCDDQYNRGEPKLGGYLPIDHTLMGSPKDNVDEQTRHKKHQGTGKIFCAHIADNFESLGHDKDFEVLPFDGPVNKLSRVIKTPDGAFADINRWTSNGSPTPSETYQS